jgi:hypothetical protein
MRDQQDDVLRVEEALVRHHRGRQPVDTPPLLAQKTVTRLREEWMRQEGRLPYGSRVSGLVWRCAMVTCLIALLMGAFGVRHDAQTEVQFAEFMMDDAAGIEWVRDFGIL